MKMCLAVFIIALILAETVTKGGAQSQCGYLRGAVRLQGGQNEREGRLEVCNDGVWGTVCDGGWEDRDATVICRQLDLLTMDTVSGSYFTDDSSGPSWLNDVDCSGSEQTIVECLTVEQQRSRWQSVQCDTSAGILCLESDGGHTIRLVGGRDEREGRVEVFYGGEWGAVCRGSSWGPQEAAVVCRELGFFDNGAVATSGDQFAGSRSNSVPLEGIQCNGDETNLFLCRGESWGRQQCPSDTAGVVCTQTGGCSEGALRLVGGRTEREGRVEKCHAGVWGTVCSGRDAAWTDTDADVVCRQLGFQDQDERGAEATDSTLFGPANGVIWLFSANCGLHTCTAHNWANNDCLHTDDVAVTCPGPKEHLQLCANIEAETMLLFETLHSFYNTVSSVMVNRVLSHCSPSCYYSTHDVSIDTYWPFPTLPVSLCVTHETTLQIRLTCSYRPHLNTNNRVLSAARTTLGSLGRVIDCGNHRGYTITKDVHLIDCMQPQTTSLRQISTSSVVVNSTISLVSVTKTINKDVSTNTQFEFGSRHKHTTSLLSTTNTVTKTSFSLSSLQVSAKQTIAVKSLTSKTAPQSFTLSPSATTTYVSEIQMTMHLTQVYTMSSISPEGYSFIATTTSTSDVQKLTHISSNSPAVDSKVLNNVSKLVNVPIIPTNEDEGTSINWFVAFLAGLIVGCIVLVLVSVLVCVFLRQKTQYKRRFSSGGDLANTPNRASNRENSMQLQVNSVNPLSSSPGTCHYEDIDSHDYAVLEQTLPPQQSPRGEAGSQSSVCLTTEGHKYAVLTCPERMHDTVSTGKESSGNCIPDAGLNTTPEYATLEPDPGIVAPASVEYSKLYTCNHDYQCVRPDPSSGYDRTFAM